MKKLLFLLIFSGTFTVLLHGQQSKYYLPVNFKDAYRSDTRSLDGRPGKAYWQNRADYRIEVALDPENYRISGTETITYVNHSPYTLEYLVLHLLPDLYKEGGARDFDIDARDAHEGLMIEKMTIDGVSVVKNNRGRLILPKPTGMYVYLPEPLKPAKQTSIDVKWNYELNKYSHYREGVVNDSSFFVAYFYPRVAVFDDIDGWNDWDYTGTTEFYNDFGDYDVTVEVPGNYLVQATGVWQNPEEILQPDMLERYRIAHSSDQVVSIAEMKDIRTGRVTRPETAHRWHFKAENVTDFAFGTSNHYLWDGTSLLVDSLSGRRVFIDALYHPDSEDFYEVAKIAREAIWNMSYLFPAIPFPYPKMTVFNGLSQMEYPMMVNDISMHDLSEAIKLTVHEIFHSYYPFYTGLNETKYAWMDEGLTSYGESVIASRMDAGNYAGYYFFDDYKDHAGHNYDVPLFVCSEILRGPVYYTNSYPKGAAFFGILHDYLGNDAFLNALQEFTVRWQGKHPTPYDLIFTFEDATGEDLSWLIRPWLFEFGYVDIAVRAVIKNEEQQVVHIEKTGQYPAPFSAKIVFDDGSEEIFVKNAGVWKSGNSVYELRVLLDREIRSVELTNLTGMDVDLTNNRYPLTEQR
ncbi:MAG: M1 family metallopeptidase [Bacteroidales bacterium]